MTKNELLAYEDFWDKLGAERLLFVDSNRINREEGRAEGRAEGIIKGRAEGKIEGRAEGKAEVARNLLHMGMSVDDVAKACGMTKEEVERLR